LPPGVAISTAAWPSHVMEVSRPIDIKASCRRLPASCCTVLGPNRPPSSDPIIRRRGRGGIVGRGEDGEDGEDGDDESMESVSGPLSINMGTIAGGTILAAGLYFGAGLLV